MHIRIDYRNGGKRHVAFCSEYHKGKAKNPKCNSPHIIDADLVMQTIADVLKKVAEYRTKKGYSKPLQNRMALPTCAGTPTTAFPARTLLGLDSDTFYIYHVAAVMVDNLRRLLLGINLSDKAIMDFDFPGVGFPV